MSNERRVIRVSVEAEKLIRQVAKARDLAVGEAADTLINTGFSRLQALSRYASKGEAAAPKKRKPAEAKRKKAVQRKEEVAESEAT